MRQLIPVAAAISLGLTAPALQARPQAAKQFPEGTRVVIVGRISSQPRNATFVHEKKMQVSVGPNQTDYTLHLKDARITGPNGHEAGISDLRDKWWVRAEGYVMDDPKRIHVENLRVFSKNRENLLGSAYYRPGEPHGYVTAVAGSRQIFRRH